MARHSRSLGSIPTYQPLITAALLPITDHRSQITAFGTDRRSQITAFGTHYQSWITVFSTSVLLTCPITDHRSQITAVSRSCAA
jgi:hypothetical protein